MNHKRKSTILMTIGLLLLAAALFLTAYNLWNQHRGEKNAQAALAELVTKMDSQLNPSEIPDYVFNPRMEMPTEEIDGEAYIGVLEIPALEVKLPVISQWNYDRLLIAPCRYAGSVYMGNMVIAAHNYDSHFGRIQNMRTGDIITFTDIDGNNFAYSVASIEILKSTAIEEMTAGEYDLTLFTCTFGGKSRVTVRCSRIVE